MAKPVSRILVINDEQLELREFVKGLNAAARTLDNPLGITFTGVTTAKEALQVLEADGNLQAVMDEYMYQLLSETGGGDLDARDLGFRVPSRMGNRRWHSSLHDSRLGVNCPVSSRYVLQVVGD